MKTRKPQQGFTLVEIAVVLVIIGLLLGGVLKGQELINSAKAKSLVQEFNSVSVMMYGYQDRFRALPGDDASAKVHVDGVVATTPGKVGNGRIEGAWDSDIKTDESYLFWQHVRLAGLATGSTDINAPNYLPTNAENGPLGVTGTPLGGLSGQFFVCSGGLSARFARQLDSTMDDGVTDTGSVRSLDETTKQAIVLTATTEGTGTYTVCAAY